MADPAVRLLVIDPLDKMLGLLVPAVTQRIIEMAAIQASEMDSKQVAMSVMSRLFARDPNLAVLAMVDGEGKCIGHAVATMETDGLNKWVFILQCRADGNVGDAIQRAIALADEWGATRGASKMLMATHRVDTAWKRKYGFDTKRVVMSRDIGKGSGEGT